MKSRANAKDPLFEELVIPERIRNFSDGLSRMGDFLKPNQLETNYVSLELARGKWQTPSYTRYIVADVSASPWHVPSAEHTAAMSKWTSNKQAPKPGAQPLPFHTWKMYRLRFIITADLCAAWIPLGGWSAQLNNLSILLHLPTTESVAGALAYDTRLSAHLEELARARANKTDGAVDFTDLLSTKQHRFKIRAIALAAKSAPQPAVPKVVAKAVTEVPKAPNKRPWIPRKQRLSQLAADKKADEAAATAAAAACSAAAPVHTRAPSNRRRTRSRSRPPSSHRLWPSDHCSPETA